MANTSPASSHRPGGAEATEETPKVSQPVEGPVNQPIRGHAGWGGLGKGVKWDESTLYKGNGETDKAGGPTESSLGTWGMDATPENRGHTVSDPANTKSDVS